MGMDAWPEEVCSAYEKMSLPSLYEIFLVNEKLAAESRKQNQEIRALREKVYQTLEKLRREEQTKEEEQENELREIEKVIITLMDSIFQLSSSSKKAKQSLLSILPAKEGWRRRSPTWRNHAERILDSYDDGVNMIQEKLQFFFDELSITPIFPKKGDPFSPQLHCAVEQCSGGKPGVIAEVYRIGYLRNGQLIRYADVKTYSQ